MRWIVEASKVVDRGLLKCGMMGGRVLFAEVSDESDLIMIPLT